MTRRLPVLSVAALAVAGLVTACASADAPGWSGAGAEPFDGARAACEAESARAPVPATAFEACMAARGWTRPD